jgi:hypothetical protein
MGDKAQVTGEPKEGDEIDVGCKKIGKTVDGV